jgi:hypothetical protein
MCVLCQTMQRCSLLNPSHATWPLIALMVLPTPSAAPAGVEGRSGSLRAPQAHCTLTAARRYPQLTIPTQGAERLPHSSGGNQGGITTAAQVGSTQPRETPLTNPVALRQEATNPTHGRTHPQS